MQKQVSIVAAILLFVSGCNKNEEPVRATSNPYQWPEVIPTHVPFPEGKPVDPKRLEVSKVILGPEPGKPLHEAWPDNIWLLTTADREDPIRRRPVISPDGKKIALYIGKKHNPLILVCDMNGRPLARGIIHPQYCGQLKWKSDSRHLLTCGTVAAELKLTGTGNTQKLTAVHVFGRPDGSTEGATVTGLYLSETHSFGIQRKRIRGARGTIISVFNQKNFDPKRPSTFHPLATLRSYAVIVPEIETSLTISPGPAPRLLALYCDTSGKWTTTVFDLSKRRQLWQRHWGGGDVKAQWSSDGRFILVSKIEKPPYNVAFGELPVHQPMEWLDAATGQRVRQLQAQRFNSLAVVAGEKIYALGIETHLKDRPGSLKIIDAKTGKSESLPCPFGVSRSSQADEWVFSKDGRHMLYDEQHSSLRYWRIADLRTNKIMPSDSWGDGDLNPQEY